jgi:undecaprenyl-diphosphatase
MSIPPFPFDESVMHALSATRTMGGTYFFINLSELAGPTTSAGVGLIVALGLVRRNKYAAIAGLAASLGGANASWVLLKALFERPRPPTEFAAFVESGFSFPSGHATNAFAFGTFLALFVWHHVPAGRARTCAAALPLLLAALIAFGRVYLGVHYLSDVCVGALLGIVFGIFGVWVWGMLEARTTQQTR